MQRPEIALGPGVSWYPGYYRIRDPLVVYISTTARYLRAPHGRLGAADWVEPGLVLPVFVGFGHHRGRSAPCETISPEHTSIICSRVSILRAGKYIPTRVMFNAIPYLPTPYLPIPNLPPPRPASPGLSPELPHAYHLPPHTLSIRGSFLPPHKPRDSIMTHIPTSSSATRL